MNTQPHQSHAQKKERLLDFRSGGWVILLAILIPLAIAGWRVVNLLETSGTGAIGDGKDPASYGFDLSNSLVPLDLITGCGISKDGLPTLNTPPKISVSDVWEINQNERGKYLVGADRVIGVSVNGEACAYPLRVLNWHEIVNDTLGGIPIAVTYHPYCDSVVVFDRRVDGEILEFGISGLVYNANLLMYDRHAGGQGESLWSQLQGRAVAGPTTGKALRLLPASLVRLDAWQEKHPETKTLARDSTKKKRYKRDPYHGYYGSDLLPDFPIRPLPPQPGPANKARVVIVNAGGRSFAYSLPEIGKLADDEGVWTTQQGGQTLRFTYQSRPETVAVEAVGADTGNAIVDSIIYTFWFAWHAQNPDAVPLP